MNGRSDFEILTNSRLWVATPWLYSSSRWLRFKNNEISDCCYGYGQTIYAVIRFEFEIAAQDTLKLTYLESPALADGLRFKGFTPSPNNRTKELHYELTEKVSIYSHQITGEEKKYHWILTLNNSPFPEDLRFPNEVPLEYYGYREC